MSSLLESAVVSRLSSVIPKVPLFLPPRDERLDELASILAMAKRLRWKHVVVMADDIQLMLAFGKAAQREDICVVANLAFNTNR
jgi:hypothetical protein